MPTFGTLGNNVTPLYGGGQVRNPANVLVLNAAPSASATGNRVGTVAVNQVTGTSYMAVKNTGISGTVTWAVLGGAAADVNTINLNAPVAGNYTLAGTANQLTVTQTAGTSTWTIPAAFIAPGSIASTTTLTGGTGITATTGDIVASAGNINATLGSMSAATSVTAASFVTSSATVGKTLSDTGLVPTGSDADINMAIAGKGTGSVIQSRGVVGGDLTIENTNTDNTNGASRSGFEVAVGGTSAGDPYVNFLVSGAGVFTMGIDNSVSDNFTLSASAALGTTDVMRVSAGGAMTKPLQPAFFGNLAAGVSDKTGNNTAYTIGTDALTEIYDQGSNFTTAGVFTAPVTGIYDLRACVRVSGMVAATADTMTLNIVTTARTYTKTITFLGTLAVQSIDLAVMADMTALDTATVTIVVNGEGADTADIDGAAGPVTFFCGSLVA